MKVQFFKYYFISLSIFCVAGGLPFLLKNKKELTPLNFFKYTAYVVRSEEDSRSVSFAKAFFVLVAPLTIIAIIPRDLSRRRSALRNLDHYVITKNDQNVNFYTDAQIKKRKKYLELVTPNLGIKLEAIMNDLEKYEAIFRLKFSRVEKEVNKKTLSFKFYYDLFDKVDADSFVTPQPWHLYLGKDNENREKVISLKEIFSIGVFAQAGSGKTHLIKRIIQNLKACTPDLEVFIFDAKLMDFDDAFIRETEAVVIPMISPDQINKGADFLEERKKIALTENMEVIRSHGFNHAEECHTRSIAMPLKRAIYIFDEMGRYGKVKGSKEMKEATKRIVELAADYLAIMRAHSQCILISTQRAHSDELDFDAFSNTQLLILNGLSKELSARYADAQVPPFAVKGKWYVRSSDGFSGFIKTQFKLKQNKD